MKNPNKFRLLILMILSIVLTNCNENSTEVTSPPIAEETLTRIQDVRHFTKQGLASILPKPNLENFNFETLNSNAQSFFNSAMAVEQRDHVYQTYELSANLLGYSQNNRRIESLEIREMSIDEAWFLYNLLDFVEGNPSISELQSYLKDKKLEILNSKTISQTDLENLTLFGETMLASLETVDQLQNELETSGRLEGDRNCWKEGAKGVVAGGVIGFTGGCAVGALLTSPTGPGSLAGCGIGGLIGGLFGGVVTGVATGIICFDSKTKFHSPVPLDPYDLSDRVHLLKERIGIRLLQ